MMVLLFALLSPSSLRPRLIFQGQKIHLRSVKNCSLVKCHILKLKIIYWIVKQHLFEYEGKIIHYFINYEIWCTKTLCFVFLYVNKGIFRIN